ncbi:MAG: outer membrane biosynthesis protein TonB [Sphingobacteriales bacterium]|jgi:outer membrane biosynthesis protein TonB
MSDLEKKNKRYGLLGTIVFHLILLGLFIFFGFITPLPLPAEKGIMINFGDVAEGSGDNIQDITENVSDSKAEANEQSNETPPPTPNSPSEQDVMTQDIEDAPEIKSSKETPKITKKDPVKEVPKEEPVVEERKVDPRALYPGKKGNPGGDGTTDKTGNQGSKDGDPTSSNYDGEMGGGDNGISLDLNGRSFVNRPKLTDNSQVAGKVVVEITVDRKGNIVTAKAGARGTTISQTELWTKCENALRGVALNSLSSAPEIQKGTVTFIFKLK